MEDRLLSRKDDEKEGIRRGAYKGVVTFARKGIRVFLVPFDRSLRPNLLLPGE